MELFFRKGTTAIVYLKNNKAIKVYQDSKAKKLIFQEFEMKNSFGRIV